MPPTENSAALFGWHSQDSRATGPLDTADTVTAHYGTGGGNTPLIVQPCICIQGSMIGRAEKNGPQGDGLNQEVCFTLNTVDEHAVAYTFAEQNYSEYVLSPAGGTIKANGGVREWGADPDKYYYILQILRIESIENWKGGNIPAERLRCETRLYWEDFNGVCFCGESPYCADFTDGDDGCCYWQQKEPATQSPADTEGIE